MDRRNFIRKTAGGSIASLLALTGKSQATALDQLAASPGINPAGAQDFLVLEPDSASFQSLTQGFNGRWSAPNARRIYLPLTETGVESAAHRILQDGHGRAFKVRGGAHCYEDFVFNPKVEAILDLSLLNAVGFDPERGVFIAQGGANNFDLQHALIRFGKTLPGGSCPTVGPGRPRLRRRLRGAESAVWIDGGLVDRGFSGATPDGPTSDYSCKLGVHRE